MRHGARDVRVALEWSRQQYPIHCSTLVLSGAACDEACEASRPAVLHLLGSGRQHAVDAGFYQLWCRKRGFF